MAKNVNTKYTYIAFAEEVKGIMEGKIEVTDEIRSRVCEKADALIATQLAKKAYNAENPKKSTAKGASEGTKAKAKKIAEVLCNEPMTAADINAELEEKYSALQIANAVKYIEGAQSTKVIRENVNSKGLRAEKEYTAYFI